MAITQNPYTGAPLYLKDSAYASKFFGGQSMLFQPKRKFLFAAGFLANMESGMMRDVQQQEMAFLVKRVETPKFTFDVDTLNQYNKKRVVQKKINYDPISITFHDDVSNTIFKLASNYIRYYYGDSYQIDYNDWNLDTVDYLRKQGLWGLMPKDQKYFFKALWIAWVNSGRVTYMAFPNPLITDIGFDSLDYSDNGTSEITFTFAYEGVIFQEINASILGQTNSEALRNVQSLFMTGDFIGQPGAGPTGSRAQAGFGDRGYGLGELFNTATTFYGKYNGKPTIRDGLNDFVFRPVKGAVSGGLGSWGNFNFGGIGEAKSSQGLLGGVAGAISPAVDYVNNAGIVDTANNVVSDAYTWGKGQFSTNAAPELQSSTTAAGGIDDSINANISPSSDPPVNNRFLDMQRRER